MGNIFLIIIKGIGIFLGTVLVSVGGFIGMENFQAPGTINIPIMLLSVTAILVGSIILWIALRKKEKRT